MPQELSPSQPLYVRMRDFFMIHREKEPQVFFFLIFLIGALRCLSCQRVGSLLVAYGLWHGCVVLSSRCRSCFRVLVSSAAELTHVVALTKPPM